NSGQYFRVPAIVKRAGFPTTYEAQINSTHGDPIRTGSLYPGGPLGRLPAEEKKKLIVNEQLHKPDEWFTQEVIAVDNHIIIKVNGKRSEERRVGKEGRRE